MRRLAIAFALLAGCGATPSTVDRPETTVASLVASLRATPSDAMNGREMNALGETLSLSPVERDARVMLVDGSAIMLVREGESWRVDRGVLGRPSLARPVDAVIALHDALARSRIAGVLSLLGRTPRAELELELTRWLEGTADPEALAISVDGEHATVTTPTGEHLQLVRESAEWHVLGL